MDSLNKKDLRLEQLMPIIRESLSQGKSVRFSPRGVSMLPMLRQGLDSVELSPLPERLKKYDLPLYQRRNGQYVLHRVVGVDGDTYTCIGDNQFELEHSVAHEQMIAVVTAFFREQKAHSVNEFGYKTYCRVWHNSRGVRRFFRRCVNRLRRCFK